VAKNWKKQRKGKIKNANPQKSIIIVFQLITSAVNVIDPIAHIKLDVGVTFDMGAEVDNISRFATYLPLL
jgi:hypothetical protein